MRCCGYVDRSGGVAFVFSLTAVMIVLHLFDNAVVQHRAADFNVAGQTGGQISFPLDRCADVLALTPQQTLATWRLI